jgi:hypothetical protein
MTIADRFALSAPSGWNVPGATSWNAHDTRLDAPVVVLIADSGDADVALAALTRARGVRDPRLARIVDVGITDLPGSDDDAAETRRAYVAVAALPDPTAAAILASRILPAPLARLLVRGAADALDAASAAGLAHGTLGFEALGVTSRGRVIVAGAGLLGAFGGNTGAAAASDAEALATLFARAVLGVAFDIVPDETVQLPADLTRSERRLVARTRKGKFPASVAALLADLGSADGATLSAIRTQLRKLERIVPPEPEAPEPEAPELEEAAPGPGAPPAGATQAEIDEWELEQLLEREEAEELPTVAEAILDLLHRRFPRSARITNALEAARARALRGPRVNGTLWTVLALLVLVSILAYIAVGIFRAPFIPTFDLKNPPPQTYPSFSFGPSPTDVTPAP